MCRSIKNLRIQGQPPTDEELRAAALQFVRKISGYRVPSKSNEAVFHCAVSEVARAGRRLFDGLQQRWLCQSEPMPPDKSQAAAS